MGPPPLGKHPIYFGTAERPLFGFYHPPSGTDIHPLGIVLCNPIGDDLIRGHRAFRHLAEALAGAGFAALRFDFDGTGDSAGDERDPDRVATWRADVARAAAELRARSGVEALALLGLKLGATLATMAAEDLGGVEALVLWGAHESGSAYVSEATKAHKMHTMLEPASFVGGPPSTDGQEALGFLLTPQTIADLAVVDLFATKRSQARWTLVIDTANLSSASALGAHLSCLGRRVSTRQLPGQKFLITRPQDSEVPQAIIDAVTGWLGEDRSLEDRPLGRSAPPLVAEAQSLRERAVTFGGPRQLFGILTSPPPAAARAGLPAIIMLNAGAIHRIGAHRLYVPMARRWAALGFQVLRVDLSGIGDSPVADGGQENLTYPPERGEDVQTAMDFLSQSVQADRFILTGLCSGATSPSRSDSGTPRWRARS